MSTDVALSGRTAAVERNVPLARGRFRRGIPAVAAFLGVWACYALIGWKVVVVQHLVVYDGWARLAHAYFVFYNQPPKLAAVGFVWPPMTTLAFLPLALIKPLATSLGALPVMSGAFAAALVLVLDRTLRLADVPRSSRFVLLTAFAANPLILFYATNGMGEIVSLLFLAIATYSLLQWYLQGGVRPIVVMSVALALGTLSRYELALWAVFVGLVVIAVMHRRRRSSAEIQAVSIVYGLPVIYAVLLWCLLSWMIMGRPLYWWRTETSAGSGVSMNSGRHPPLLEVLRRLLVVNTGVSVAAAVLLVVLLLVAVIKRDLMAAGIAGFLGINALFTGVLFYASDNTQYFELRYNMRGVPVVIAATAWLYLLARRRYLQRIVVGAVVALLVISAPITWRAMAKSHTDFLEDAFARALFTTSDRTGSTGYVLGGTFRVGIDREMSMARYIREHVDGHDAVLTDDGASFAVMLLDGRPGVYFDRIDKGDATWQKTLDDPWGHVAYLLVSPHSVAGAPDLALERYPALATGGQAGFTEVYANERYVLFRVATQPPARG